MQIECRCLLWHCKHMQHMQGMATMARGHAAAACCHSSAGCCLCVTCYAAWWVVGAAVVGVQHFSLLCRVVVLVMYFLLGVLCG